MTIRTALVPLDKPRAWLCRDKIMQTDHVLTDSALVNYRSRHPDAWEITPLYAASPRAGRVGLDVLEMAAMHAYMEYQAQASEFAAEPEWDDLTQATRDGWIAQQRCALAVMGLAVEEAA